MRTHNPECLLLVIKAMHQHISEKSCELASLQAFIPVYYLQIYGQSTLDNSTATTTTMSFGSLSEGQTIEALTADQNPSEFTGPSLDLGNIFRHNNVAVVSVILVSNCSQPTLAELIDCI